MFNGLFSINISMISIVFILKIHIIQHEGWIYLIRNFIKFKLHIFITIQFLRNILHVFCS